MNMPVRTLSEANLLGRILTETRATSVRGTALKVSPLATTALFRHAGFERSSQIQDLSLGGARLDAFEVGQALETRPIGIGPLGAHLYWRDGLLQKGSEHRPEFRIGANGRIQIVGAAPVMKSMAGSGGSDSPSINVLIATMRVLREQCASVQEIIKILGPHEGTLKSFTADLPQYAELQQEADLLMKRYIDELNRKTIAYERKMLRVLDSLTGTKQDKLVMAQMSEEIERLNSKLFLQYEALSGILPVSKIASLEAEQFFHDAARTPIIYRSALNQLIGCNDDTRKAVLIRRLRSSIRHVGYSVDSLLRNIRFKFTERASQSNILITLQHDNMHIILLDPERLRFLERVLENLFENAIKYSWADNEDKWDGRGHKQVIIAFKDNTFVVQDLGVGIEDTANVLGHRYRENRTSAEGTGMGLASVVFCLEKLGFPELQLESVIGRGTRATVRVPDEYVLGEFPHPITGEVVNPHMISIEWLLGLVGEVRDYFLAQIESLRMAIGETTDPQALKAVQERFTPDVERSRAIVRNVDKLIAGVLPIFGVPDDIYERMWFLAPFIHRQSSIFFAFQSAYEFLDRSLEVTLRNLNNPYQSNCTTVLFECRGLAELRIKGRREQTISFELHQNVHDAQKIKWENINYFDLVELLDLVFLQAGMQANSDVQISFDKETCSVLVQIDNAADIDELGTKLDHANELAERNGWIITFAQEQDQTTVILKLKTTD